MAKAQVVWLLESVDRKGLYLRVTKEGRPEDTTRARDAFPFLTREKARAAEKLFVEYRIIRLNDYAPREVTIG